MLYSSWWSRSSWSRTSHSPNLTFIFGFGVVATQCAAVTTHRFDTSAPPQLSLRDKNPDLINAACQGCDAKVVEWPPTMRFERVNNSPQPASERKQNWFIGLNWWLRKKETGKTNTQRPAPPPPAKQKKKRKNKIKTKTLKTCESCDSYQTVRLCIECGARGASLNFKKFEILWNGRYGSSLVGPAYETGLL